MSSRGLRFGLSRSHGAHVADDARRFRALFGTRLGLTVHLAMTSDYEELLRSLLAGKIDLAWMPPLLHARALPHGARLLALCDRGRALSFRSAIVVQRTSSFVQLTDLRRIRAAWSDPASASGYLVPRLHLARAGIRPGQHFLSERFHGTMTAACTAVADGTANLCACFVSDEAGNDRSRALLDLAHHYPAAEAHLRVLDVTTLIPADGLVLAPAVDPALSERVVGALLGLHQQRDGDQALAELFQARRLEPPLPEILRMAADLLALVEDAAVGQATPAS